MQALPAGRDDKVTPLRFVIPSVCELAVVALQQPRRKYHLNKKEMNGQAVHFFFGRDDKIQDLSFAPIFDDTHS